MVNNPQKNWGNFTLVFSIIGLIADLITIGLFVYVQKYSNEVSIDYTLIISIIFIITLLTYWGFLRLYVENRLKNIANNKTTFDEFYYNEIVGLKKPFVIIPFVLILGLFSMFYFKRRK